MRSRGLRWIAFGILVFGPVPAIQATEAAPPDLAATATSENSDGLGVCSCWCWCEQDPTTKQCNGGGSCCWGAEDRRPSPSVCVCDPCLVIFGATLEKTDPSSGDGKFPFPHTTTACRKAAQGYLDWHVASLRLRARNAGR